MVLSEPRGVEGLFAHGVARRMGVTVEELVRLRYQRGSIVLTANRDAKELGKLFGDPLLASAAMDRLLHDAHVLVFDGESYNPSPGRRRRGIRVSSHIFVLFQGCPRKRGITRRLPPFA